MRGLFVVHASIWDMVVLTLGAVFVGAYFILWAAAAWQARKKKQ